MTRQPKYRLHKPTGQALVEIGRHRYYLGRHGTPGSLERYHELLARWAAGGFHLSPQVPDLTIVELAAAYERFARTYYTKAGKVTTSVSRLRTALRPLVKLYGRTSAATFGPSALKVTRGEFIRLGVARPTVNGYMQALKRMFRWAVESEMIPPAVLEGLRSVPGLRRGRSAAREPEPIGPVSNDVATATLPYLSRVLQKMIRFQQVTGARPAEVCGLRIGDVDRSGDVWACTIRHHKTEHCGRGRVVLVGPRGQELIRDLLRGPPDRPVFSPRAAVAELLAKRRAARTTPPGQGNGPGTNKKRHPKVKPGVTYGTASYRRAIARACEQAFPVPSTLAPDAVRRWKREHHWAPNQLRHSFATMVRRQYGLEAAQVLLGHSKCDTTQLYAERDSARGRAVAAEIG